MDDFTEQFTFTFDYDTDNSAGTVERTVNTAHLDVVAQEILFFLQAAGFTYVTGIDLFGSDGDVVASA